MNAHQAGEWRQGSIPKPQRGQVSIGLENKSRTWSQWGEPWRASVLQTHKMSSPADEHPGRPFSPRLGFQAAVSYISGMLRIRPKPPSCIPPLNRGKDWSADDIADLDDMLGRGAPASVIAEYLRRDVLEVISKIAERRR